jgi:WD40 repeat protein
MMKAVHAALALLLSSACTLTGPSGITTSGGVIYPPSTTSSGGAVGPENVPGSASVTNSGGAVSYCCASTGYGGEPNFGGVTSRSASTSSGSVTNPGGRTNAVAYSPDGQLLAVGAEGAKPNVHLRRLSDGAAVRDIEGIGGVTYSIAFSPDGNTLAAAGAQSGGGNSSPTPNIVKLWDVASGSLVRTIPASCGFYSDSVSFSHNGTLLVTAGYVGPVEVWRVSDGVRVASIPYPTSVHNVHFSPDDSRLIVGGVDYRVTVWSLSDATLVLTLNGTADEMADGDFSPNSRLIATTGADWTGMVADYTGINNAIKIWDADTGVLLQSLAGHNAYVSHVVWIDDAHLISDDWTGQVFLWTATAGVFSESRAWSTGAQALGLAVSPDKTQVAVAGGNEITFLSLAP